MAEVKTVHDYTHKTTPYKHQSDTLRNSWSKSWFAFLMEMGTGKSKVAIDTLAMQYWQRMVRGGVIVAPKGAYLNWSNSEIPTHMPDWVKPYVFVWKGGKSKDQKRQMEVILDCPDCWFPIILINVEAFSSKSDRALDFVEAFLKKVPSIMIVDESTTIKNRSSGRTKALMYLSRFAKTRRILTGTPVTKSPLDIWSQFEFLSKGCLGFHSYWAFRARYAIMKNQYLGTRVVKVVDGYQNQDELQRRVAEHSVRILKKDCLDLPPKIYERRQVDLSDEQRRVYEGVRENAMARLESGDHVTATEVITQIIRLQQITCGFVVDENKQTHFLPETRTDTLIDAIEEAGCPCIIWTAYRATTPAIYKALSKMGRVVQYHGGVAEGDRERAVKEFQDGTATYFLGTPHTGGRGLTLTAAGAVLYYCNSYNLELREQSEDRAHRIGQHHNSVTYVDLVADGTVDERVLTVLRKKIDLAAAVVGDGYKEWII